MMLELDNQKKTTLIKWLLIRLPFIVLLGIGTSTLLEWIHGYSWLIAASALFIITLMAVFILRFQYVRINEYDDRWEFRFFRINPLSPGYQMIMVHKDKLSGVTMKKSLGGLKTELIIEEQTAKGTAVYPALCMTLFSAGQLAELRKRLEVK